MRPSKDNFPKNLKRDKDNTKILPVCSKEVVGNTVNPI